MGAYGIPNPLFLGGLVGLEGVAANVLAIKNGTAAQALRVYGTTTGPQYVEIGHSGNAYIDVQGGAALSFRMNGVSQWFLSAAGHLLADADNTEDIGASGATRPRTIYVGTSVEVGATPATAGALRIANATYLYSRNAANSSNVALIGANASNQVVLGYDGSTQWDIRVAGTTGCAIGFFGTAPALKPTGVAVTAAGIHAALVTLGLIAA